MKNLIKSTLNHQKKVRCSDMKSYSVIRNTGNALKKAYIELNPQNSYEWIIVDCDYDVPYHKDLAISPNYMVRNLDNNKAHLFYKINAVHKNEFSSKKAQDYYHAIRYGVTIAVDGDLSFNQKLCKNPLATDCWRVEHIHDREYELRELAEYCEVLPKSITNYKASNYTGEGRNDTVFNKARILAYKLPLSDNLYDQVYKLCQQENDLFVERLADKEINHIAKSITRYLISKKNQFWYQKLVERQKERGIKSGKKRQERSEVNKASIIPLLYTNKTLQAIADFIGTSLSTIKRVAREFKESLANAKKVGCREPYQVVPACGSREAFFGAKQFSEVDSYLADTFSLYQEDEKTVKIPLNTISRLLL